jgi:hypothetical protein
MEAMLSSKNQLRADNQQGRPRNLEEPSETTRQTPRVTEAYLLGSLHDGTYNVRRKTHRFSQANIGWLQNLQRLFGELGHKAWIYKEGRNRNVYVLETSAKFLSIQFDPSLLTSTEEKVAFIRGFFDAEGGVPINNSSRFYIQLVQKNQVKIAWLHSTLKDMNIRCGVIHIPSKRVDPNYFRFFISAQSYKDFIEQIGSWHPRKKLVFESRLKI